jgi:4'-phosphopantetheinyl transferase
VHLLSSDELEKASRFAFQELRDAYIVGRGLTRCLLSARVKLQPHSIRFQYSVRGKPYLDGQHEWHFNVSHSKSLFVCAVTNAGEIGVDIEQVRPMRDAQAIAARFFSISEARRLGLLPQDRQMIGFFECWTRKEAFLKATGEGLSRNTQSVSATFGPGETARFERIDEPHDNPSAWSLKGFVPAEGYVGAVAMRAPIGEVHVWRVDAAWPLQAAHGHVKIK